MYKIMTPGPTQVSENVRLARSLPCTNPDLDESFVDFYHTTCLKISQLLHTKHETLILGGEGILSLEAACASLIEPGDHVLVIDNGLYGNGFADFVSMYQGIPELYTKDYKRAIDPKELADYLKEHHNFKIATLVHCDTPSGMLNPVEDICKELKKYDILTIVDAVSSLFGEPLSLENIDILCGGSQKVISAPPGLCFTIISAEAKEKINRRKTPIASFYANLKMFFSYYEDKWFPYTMPISDLYGMAQAIENIEKDDMIYERHKEVAKYCRNRLQSMGLSLYGENGFSNTVSAFKVPAQFTSEEILLKLLEKYKIMIAGSFGPFQGKILRIGHMGMNANMEDIKKTLDALEEVIFPV